MTQRETLVRLDTPQARDAFRMKYDDSVFRTAYAITGLHREAQQLTQALFEDVEKTFARKTLPDAPELYLLSRIHLIYARGDWRRQKVTQRAAFSQGMPAQQPYEPERSDLRSFVPGEEGAAALSGSVLLGQVVYIPQGSLTQAVPAMERVHRRRRRVVIPAAEEPVPVEIPSVIAAPAEPAVPVAEAVPVREPEPAPEAAADAEPAVAVEPAPAKEPEAVAKPTPIVTAAPAKEQAAGEAVQIVAAVQAGSYDPELTEMWTPEMDAPEASQGPAQRRPAEAGAALKAEKPAASRADMPAKQETPRAEERIQRRSPLLTGFNVLLTLGAIGAAAYLVMSLNLF